MVDSQVTAITPATHASRHSVGGDDPLVTPVLIDPHHTTHETGGSDVVETVTAMSANLTGSRTDNTTYQNTHDTTMYVYCRINAAGVGTGYISSTSPASCAISHAVDGCTVTMVVPAGWYYKIDFGGANQSWYEIY